MGQIKWKPDHKGRPRRMPASYIMAKDGNALAAYRTLRKKGITPTEAEHQIERCFEACFRRVLLSEIQDHRRADPRPECWLLLAEGIPVERIFPDLEQLGLTAGQGYQLI